MKDFNTIELILLPPKEQVEVTRKDVVQAYAEMIDLLLDAEQNRLSA